MHISTQKPPVLSYIHSVLSGLAHSLSWDAWRALSANFRKALTIKHAHFCLKAGLAAVLSDYFAEWGGLEHGLWAPMSALIVMQVQVSASVDASLMRLLGTVVGGGMGLGAFWLMHSTGWGIIPAIFLVGCVGAFLQVWDVRFRLAGITAVLVLLLGGSQFDTTYTFAVDRVLEMGMGIASALVVSAFLWPHSVTQDLAKTVEGQFRQGAALLHTLTTTFVQGQKVLPPDFMDAYLNSISANIAEYKKVHDYEACYARVAYPHLRLYMRVLDAVRVYLAGMFDALHGPQLRAAPLRLEPEVRALSVAVEGALCYIAAAGTPSGSPHEAASGGEPDAASPVPVRAALAALRTRVEQLREDGYFQHMDEEKVVQIFAFYHALFRLGSVAARMQDHMRLRPTEALPAEDGDNTVV